MFGNIYEITKIEIQKKNKNRISIYIDGQYAFGIHKDIFFKYNLEKGKLLDKEFVDKIIKEEEQNRANSYALKLLYYRPRSEKEIREKMNLKGYDTEVINKTIEYLKEFSYINDKEFAKEFAKIKSNKYGRNRIKMELTNKGINEEIINDVIDTLINDDSEYEKAFELAMKKMKIYKDDDRNAIYRKLGSYLQRKGFSYDIISKVLRKILNDTDYI